MEINNLIFKEVKTLKGKDVAHDIEEITIGNNISFIEVRNKFKKIVKRIPAKKGAQGNFNNLRKQLEIWLRSDFLKYRLYEAPDGTQGSYKHFLREVDKGNLHGLVVSV